MQEGSGWYLKKGVERRKPYSGVQTPAWFRLHTFTKTHIYTCSLSNIENRDDIFLYCILASLRPTAIESENVEHYRQCKHEVNISGIKYLVTLT